MIPEDWEATTIGDVVSFSGGSQPPRSTFRFTPREGYIRLIQIRDYKTNEFETFIPETFARKTCKPDDIMIGRYGPPIFQILRGIEGAYNVALIKTEPSPRITREYLFNVLKQDSLFRLIESLSRRSSGQTGVEMPALKKFSLPLPSLREQHAIATALSDVDALISAQEKLIAKKRNLKQAAMQQLLTGKQRLPGFRGEWEVKRLGDIFQALSTANNPRADLSEFGDVGYVHYGDIHTHSSAFLDCGLTTLPLISRERVTGIPLVQDGDLVMADASEDYKGIGKCVEVQNIQGRNIVAGLHTFLLRGDKGLLADGYKGYLQFIPTVKAALIRMATGISVYGVSKSNVKKIEVLLPRPEEQTAIATVLSDMDAEIATLEQKRGKTRLLKQGMMQELLTGRVRLIN